MPALEGADGSKLIYAGRDLGLDSGATLTIDVWNSCRTKSGREDKGCASFSLIAEEGATAVLSHKEGSQRTTVTVTGARLAEVASCLVSAARFVAVGNDGFRPVIWGLGETEAAAIADALAQDEGPESADSLSVHPCTPAIEARVALGDVSWRATGTAQAD